MGLCGILEIARPVPDLSDPLYALQTPRLFAIINRSKGASGEAVTQRTANPRCTGSNPVLPSIFFAGVTFSRLFIFFKIFLAFAFTMYYDYKDMKEFGIT